MVEIYTIGLHMKSSHTSKNQQGVGKLKCTVHMLLFYTTLPPLKLSTLPKGQIQLTVNKAD